VRLRRGCRNYADPPFIGLTIAVVVLAVAHLLARADGTRAVTPLTANTGLGAGYAFPLIAAALLGLARSALAALIGLTIAVVVQAIAHFTAGVNVTDAVAPTATGTAGLGAARANAGLTGVTRSSLPRLAFGRRRTCATRFLRAVGVAATTVVRL